MMKYTPRVRSDTAPITVANSAAMPIASGMPIQPLTTPSVIRMPTVYAPMPKKAACPKDTRPP